MSDCKPKLVQINGDYTVSTDFCELEQECYGIYHV